MVIGNKKGGSDKLLSMENDFYPDRFELWQRLRKEPGWSSINLEEEGKDEL